MAQTPAGRGVKAKMENDCKQHKECEWDPGECVGDLPYNCSQYTTVQSCQAAGCDFELSTCTGCSNLGCTGPFLNNCSDHSDVISCQTANCTWNDCQVTLTSDEDNRLPVADTDTESTGGGGGFNPPSTTETTINNEIKLNCWDNSGCGSNYHCEGVTAGTCSGGDPQLSCKGNPFDNLSDEDECGPGNTCEGAAAGTCEMNPAPEDPSDSDELTTAPNDCTNWDYDSRVSGPLQNPTGCDTQNEVAFDCRCSKACLDYEYKIWQSNGQVGPKCKSPGTPKPKCNSDAKGCRWDWI
jgi:hypothetical protein